MGLVAVDSGSLPLCVSSHLVNGQQRLGYHPCGLVSIGRGEAHAKLEAGGAEDAAQGID